jgi:hypothetical protein
MPAYFLKSKQGYTVRKMEKINGYSRLYIDKFRYAIPAYTGQFRALIFMGNLLVSA